MILPTRSSAGSTFGPPGRTIIAPEGLANPPSAIAWLSILARETSTIESCVGASLTVEELTDALVSAPLVHGDDKRRGPPDPAALTDLESRFHVKLPSDVRVFYSRMDGTDMLDAEHGLITLWPLDRWTRLDQEAPQYARDAPAGAIVFADYSLWCWAYAAELEPGSERMIVHIVGGFGGVPIAETFTEFLELVVTNSRRLFGKAG